MLAREVTVSPAPSWLPDGQGVALATSAPAAVFAIGRGRRTTIRTAEGAFVVEARGETTALGALPPALARAAVTRELRAERRAEAYAAWTIRMQKAAATKLVCERDRLPELGVVSLSAFAPFLSLHEGYWRRTESASADSVRAVPKAGRFAAGSPLRISVSGARAGGYVSPAPFLSLHEGYWRRTESASADSVRASP